MRDLTARICFHGHRWRSIPMSNETPFIGLAQVIEVLLTGLRQVHTFEWD